METLIEEHSLILTEAAIAERLRRSGRVALHPTLASVPLIYDDRGREELTKIYQSYISVAEMAKVPILLNAPTWRADYERVTVSGVDPNINSDAIHFMQDLRKTHGSDATTIKIGGFFGCKNDTYRPEEGLSVTEAEAFHSWQVNQLAESGAEFLAAGTLPNVEEATGIAKAMDATGTPYIIGFVIDHSGFILDGTSLWDAIVQIDSATKRKPLCYMISCSYPTFLNAEEQPSILFTRLLGYQANSSALRHSELDGSEQLQREDIVQWTEEMLKLNREYGVKILGGCCGTDHTYLLSLARGRAG